MTAAKTVSRASPAFSAGAATMTETISATSMTVTAMARTSVPNGSPVRWATTSAWYTAANTVAINATPAAAAMRPPTTAKGVSNRMTQANTGHVHAHQGVGAAVMPQLPLHYPTSGPIPKFASFARHLVCELRNQGPLATL